MKRLMAALAFSVMLVVPGIASATAVKKDFVLGWGEISGNNTFIVAALSDADGSNARGFVKIKDPDQSFTAKVVCLRVSGNRATLLADVVKQVGRPDLVGGGVEVRLADNGRNGQPVKDEFSNTTYGQAAWQVRRPLGCLPPLAPMSPIIRGEIKVGDDVSFGYPSNHDLDD
jgi:hypothetical protein